jgi:hypothetical protein
MPPFFWNYVSSWKAGGTDIENSEGKRLTLEHLAPSGRFSFRN